MGSSVEAARVSNAFARVRVALLIAGSSTPRVKSACASVASPASAFARKTAGFVAIALSAANNDCNAGSANHPCTRAKISVAHARCAELGMPIAIMASLPSAGSARSSTSSMHSSNSSRAARVSSPWVCARSARSPTSRTSTLRSSCAEWAAARNEIASRARAARIATLLDGASRVMTSICARSSATSAARSCAYTRASEFTVSAAVCMDAREFAPSSVCGAAQCNPVAVMSSDAIGAIMVACSQRPPSDSPQQ